MATGTLPLRDRRMRAHCRRSELRGHVMAGVANGPLIVDQHSFVRRSMGGMTFDTFLAAEWDVHRTAFQILEDRSVAVETELVGVRFEQATSSGGMRLMTLIALPHFDRHVRRFLDSPGISVLMTLDTHVNPVGASQGFVLGSMRRMAIGAFPAVHRGMDVFELQASTHILVATQAKLIYGAGKQVRFHRPVPAMAGRAILRRRCVTGGQH